MNGSERLYALQPGTEVTATHDGETVEFWADGLPFAVIEFQVGPLHQGRNGLTDLDVLRVIHARLFRDRNDWLVSMIAIVIKDLQQKEAK